MFTVSLVCGHQSHEVAEIIMPFIPQGGHRIYFEGDAREQLRVDFRESCGSRFLQFIVHKDSMTSYDVDTGVTTVHGDTCVYTKE